MYMTVSIISQEQSIMSTFSLMMNKPYNVIS